MILYDARYQKLFLDEDLILQDSLAADSQGQMSLYALWVRWRFGGGGWLQGNASFLRFVVWLQETPWDEWRCRKKFSTTWNVANGLKNKHFHGRRLCFSNVIPWDSMTCSVRESDLVFGIFNFLTLAKLGCRPFRSGWNLLSLRK